MAWELLIVNHTKCRIARKALQELTHFLYRELRKRSLKNEELGSKLNQVTGNSLTCVFLSSSEMRRVNRQFRGKNSVTDVLSFETPEGLGELLFCFDRIRSQAQDQGHSTQKELAYMFIHGVLHLLGYDHESSLAEAVQMFALQDELFEKWVKL